MTQLFANQFSAAESGSRAKPTILQFTDKSARRCVTETTGLDPLNGDGVVEIEAVELINRSTQRADVSSLPMPAT